MSFSHILCGYVKSNSILLFFRLRMPTLDSLSFHYPIIHCKSFLIYYILKKILKKKSPGNSVFKGLAKYYRESGSDLVLPIPDVYLTPRVCICL